MTSTSESAPGAATEDDETQLVKQRPEAVEKAAAVTVGSSIGRYVVIDEIGSGGMGVVIRAYDPRLHREVALKRLRPGLLDTEAEARLVREAQAMAQLSHPNVIAVYDVEQTDEGVVLAMEFVEGRTLRTWMKRQRPWRQVLEVFLQAGRGLEAAHKVGLVHRDFKPSNVLVGDDGRVRVMDFGLARLSSHKTEDSIDPSRGEDPPGLPSVPSVSWSDDSLSKPLTQVGVVMGTPVYMAPEQHVGTAADAAADQYAFCVALWEALCGDRPFKGSARELVTAKREGPPAWPRERADVPRRIAEAVRRGLAAKPSDRWTSMTDVLVELGRDPAKKIRSWAMGAGAAAVLVAGGVGLGAWQSHRNSQCAKADTELAGVWDEDRRDALTQALSTTDTPFAPVAAQQTASLLDGYAQAWVETRIEACEATTIRGEQSVEVLSLRMGCLDRARLELEATASTLIEGPAEAVPHAVDMAVDLPALQACSDVEGLMSQAKPPADPEQLRDVEDIRRILAAAAVERRAGRSKAALEQVEPLIARAEIMAYPPILAEVHRARGALHEANGAPDRATADYEEAYRTALQHEHDEVATLAVIDMTRVVGSVMRRFDEAQVWGQSAVGLARQRSMGGWLEALAQLEYGVAQSGMQAHDDAIASLQRALEILEKQHGPEHPAVARALDRLGRAVTAGGHPSEALPHHERARVIRERAYGSTHPAMAESLIGIGEAELALERPAQARAALERAAALIAADEASTERAELEFALGRAVWLDGDRATGRQLVERAAGVFERAGEPHEASLERVRTWLGEGKAVGSTAPGAGEQGSAAQAGGAQGSAEPPPPAPSEQTDDEPAPAAAEQGGGDPDRD